MASSRSTSSQSCSTTGPVDRLAVDSHGGNNAAAVLDFGRAGVEFLVEDRTLERR
jgi:hypothetical protein